MTNMAKGKYKWVMCQICTNVIWQGIRDKNIPILHLQKDNSEIQIIRQENEETNKEPEKHFKKFEQTKCGIV